MIWVMAAEICSVDARRRQDLIDVGEPYRQRRVGRLDGRLRRIETGIGARVKLAQRVDRIRSARLEVEALWFTLERVRPVTRYLMVVQGASRISS